MRVADGPFVVEVTELGFSLVLPLPGVRRWRFDVTRGEVQFSWGLPRLFMCRDATLLERADRTAGERRKPGDPASERVTRVSLADVERAFSASWSVRRSAYPVHALALRLKDGRTVIFGQPDSFGRDTKAQAAAAINRLLASVPGALATPSSVNAESVAGSSVAIPAVHPASDQ